MNKLTIYSGGQTGVDAAALRAAKSLRIPTGGWMPRGWLTEDGPRPEYAELYGMKEHSSPAYPPRTHKNAADADMTIWLGRTGSPGYWCTKKGCDLAKKPFREFTEPFPGEHLMFYVVDQIASRFQDGSLTLNCAGPRESTQPGIGVRAEAFLHELFKALLERLG
jgi:hypothetical protein